MEITEVKICIGIIRFVHYCNFIADSGKLIFS